MMGDRQGEDEQPQQQQAVRPAAAAAAASAQQSQAQQPAASSSQEAPPSPQQQTDASPFDKQIEAAKAAKEAFQAHSEAEAAMKKAQTVQVQAQEKAREAVQANAMDEKAGLVSQQAGPQQPMPSSTTIQSMVLQAANQATLTAQANLGVAMSASALAQDPAHQQLAKQQAEAAQQQMVMAQELAVAAQSPETAMQAAQSLNIIGSNSPQPSCQPMQLG